MITLPEQYQENALAAVVVKICMYINASSNRRDMSWLTLCCT